MIYVTCRLTAKNRDQLRNPTLGNRVWAAFLKLFLALLVSLLNAVPIALSPCHPSKPAVTKCLRQLIPVLFNYVCLVFVVTAPCRISTEMTIIGNVNYHSVHLPICLSVSQNCELCEHI